MYRETSSDGSVSYSNQTTYVQAGSYFLRFWPVIPIRLSSVKTLILHQNIDKSTAQPAIFLWNYTSSRWDQVKDLSQNEIGIPNPDQYVGPGGELRLRLDGDNQQSITINRLDFDLTVSR